MEAVIVSSKFARAAQVHRHVNGDVTH